VTQNTSSHSAKDTPRTEDALEAAGIPRKNIDPLSVDTLQEMMAARSAQEAEVSDARYFFWNGWGRLKHVFGVHTFVELEEWNTSEGSMRYVGRACWHCDTWER
jgi:hypothetical protein